MPLEPLLCCLCGKPCNKEFTFNGNPVHAEPCLMDAYVLYKRFKKAMDILDREFPLRIEKREPITRLIQ